ncbi:hypothetical protein COCNU_03G014550 [Cocos nucifera]|uniref:DNA mismatch repair proteins mutS family domain-containing protein n=1 Tax=Cocos nucifera TaxID=13894 RepID=A0A8K0MZU2_COCNU|nr:hypothetical protein COCNU_03G014550 [Cocos nucifera]
MEEEVGETEVESQVYMACLMQGHRVGIAYYDSSVRQLFVTEVWEDGNGEFPLIDLVKYQANPVVVYASTKTEEALLSALQQNGGSEATVVKLIRSSVFCYEQAWHSCNKFTNGNLHHYVFLTSSHRDKFLKLDAAAYEALQIFQVDKHPSHMGIGRAKEGFSVFGMFNKVMGVIDVQRSKEKAYETLVKEGICDELDELRMIYEGLPDFLEQVSSFENASLPFLHGSKKVPRIVYIHQIGYLMCIFNEKLDEDILEKLQDFEFAFSEDGDEKKYFYHTSKTRELDNLLGDIYHKILDMERAIIRDLVSRIIHFVPQLIMAVNFAAELDCFLSLALVAQQNNYVRPILTEDTLLDIQNGRHVLQEMTIDTFVPNDTKILNTGRINIITGPNYSGKSIYIKQVALVVFLSHVGSFVPADAAVVGMTDRIFCAMGSKPMTTGPSTFMIDLHQVGMMLRQATSRSLCLLDEFGKGTLTKALMRKEWDNGVLNLGVPDEVVERAAFILELFKSKKLIDRLLSQKLLAKDQEYKDVVAKLLAFDAFRGDLNMFFQDIFSESFS